MDQIMNPSLALLDTKSTPLFFSHQSILRDKANQLLGDMDVPESKSYYKHSFASHHRFSDTRYIYSSNDIGKFAQISDTEPKYLLGRNRLPNRGQKVSDSTSLFQTGSTKTLAAPTCIRICRQSICLSSKNRSARLP